MINTILIIILVLAITTMGYMVTCCELEASKHKRAAKKKIKNMQPILSGEERGAYIILKTGCCSMYSSFPTIEEFKAAQKSLENHNADCKKHRHKNLDKNWGYELKTKTPIIERLPPQNTDTERLVLGAILFDNNAIDKISNVLQPSDFYRAAHKTLYKAMIALHDKDDAIDAVILSLRLDAAGDLENCGGSNYIIDLLGDTTTAANIFYHARIVHRMAVLRNLISTACDIERKAYEMPVDFEKFLSEVDSKIIKITLQKTDNKPEKLAVAMERTIQEDADIAAGVKQGVGIKTGFTNLDIITGGFRPGQLIVIGARPGIGKTAFAVNIANYVTKTTDKKVLFLSLEMSRDEIARRVTCAEASINSKKMKRPKNISENEWEAINTGYKRINDSDFYTDDTGGLSINALYSKARVFKAEYGLDEVFVDYLQLMRGENGVRYQNRNAEITAITKALKGLAKTLQVPVVALSQLNRDAAKKNDRPRLIELRESGSIEQDADIVLFLHREINEIEPDNVVTELIVAKHRNGETGKFPLMFMKPYFLFGENY